MPKDFLREIQENKLSLLSAIGSLASIVALGIVLIEKTSSNSDIPAQLAGWRFVFFLISVCGMAGTIIFTLKWCQASYKDEQKPEHRRILATFLRAILGLLIFGVCLDALFAALNWQPWLYGLIWLFQVYL